MKKKLGILVRLVIPSMIVGMMAMPAMAQDKAKDAKAPAAAPAAAKKGEPVLEVYFENDHVRVFKATFKPGDTAANVPRPKRVAHVIKGGTLTLMYPDGKKEPLVFKTGETVVREASPQYAPRNEGKSDIVLHLVYIKEPKK